MTNINTLCRDGLDFDRNMVQLLHSLEHLISAEEKKKIARNAARLEEKMTADAFMGVSAGAANGKDKGVNVPVKQFQGHNVELDASSLMWSGDQVGEISLLLTN